eukprot:602214_1
MDEGETLRFNFNRWVDDNKLNEIKDLLRKHKMTNSNALRTSSPEYFKLMSDPALLIEDMLPTLMTALQKVPMNKTHMKRTEDSDVNDGDGINQSNHIITWLSVFLYVSAMAALIIYGFSEFIKTNQVTSDMSHTIKNASNVKLHKSISP